MPDATKAMQQIDGLEIANQKISVKIAAMSAAETAAAALASQVDLDGADGAPARLLMQSVLSGLLVQPHTQHEAARSWQVLLPVCCSTAQKPLTSLRLLQTSMGA